MTLARMGVVAAAILSVATVASAQKPDFSGAWTLDAASAQASAGGAGGGVLGNGPAKVSQTNDALTVERTADGSNVTLTFRLDGTDSRNMLSDAAGRQADAVSNVRWDGRKLAIVTKQEMNGQLAESTEVWTVDGSTLTVETSNARGARKQVYKK